MMQFNPDRITKLVSELRKAVKYLKQLSSTEKDEFLDSPDKMGSAKYNLIVAIEICIDICNHIISQNNFRAPNDYADTFQVIHENKGFDDSFIKNLKKMAKFRNRLVHLYWETDDEQVYSILQTRLGDLISS